MPMPEAGSTEPTKVCSVCGKHSDEGYVELYKDHVLVSVTCRGCDITRRFDRHRDTGVITTWLVTEVAARNYDLSRGRTVDPRGRPIERADEVRAIAASLERIQIAVREFEQAVWFGGLQKAARASRTKGMRGHPDVGPVSLISYTMAGRAMVTIEDATTQVTLITIEDEEKPCMGLRGIEATEAQALALLKAVREAWAAGRVEMREDRGVSV